MTTYSVPLFGAGSAGRDFMGVVTADITLGRLQAYLDRIRLGTTGYAALLSREGRLLSHPDSRLLMKPVSEALPRLASDPAWQEALARALDGETGTARVPCPHAAGDVPLRLFAARRDGVAHRRAVSGAGDALGPARPLHQGRRDLDARHGAAGSGGDAGVADHHETAGRAVRGKRSAGTGRSGRGVAARRIGGRGRSSGPARSERCRHA